MKKPGRRRLDDNDESVPVHVNLPARDYDAAVRRAKEAGVSVPEIIRRDLRAAAQERIAARRDRGLAGGAKCGGY